MAQGQLDAHYIVTLGGISFGRGAWVIDVKADQFTAAVSGATWASCSCSPSGRGTSAARGNVAAGGQLTATSYRRASRPKKNTTKCAW